MKARLSLVLSILFQSSKMMASFLLIYMILQPPAHKYLPHKPLLLICGRFWYLI